MRGKLIQSIEWSLESAENVPLELIYSELLEMAKYMRESHLSVDIIEYMYFIIMGLAREDASLYEDYHFNFRPIEEGIVIEIDMGDDLELEIEVYEDYCNVAIYEDIEVLDKTSGIDQTEVVELALSYMNRWS